MKRDTAIIVGLAAVGTGIAIGIAQSRRPHVRLVMDRTTDRSAADVISAAIDVEREPDTIPFVRQVEVLVREDRQVRYRVHGSTLGFPWRAQFRKTWDLDAGTAEWTSEKASYGIRTSGTLCVRPSDHGSIVHLDTGYSVRMPGVGSILEAAMKPALTYAFSVWLDGIVS